MPRAAGIVLSPQPDARRAAPLLGRGAALLLLFASKHAQAAGGAHVIDDAGVEAPGTCHLESWATHFRRGATLFVAAPGCTHRNWRRLELDGYFQHDATDGDHATAFGPGFKLALSSDEARLRLAISASVTLRGDGRFEAAGIIVPVTLSIARRAAVHANIGYLRQRVGQREALFGGLQIERVFTRRLAFMAEAFARDRGRPGFQTGLRWTPVPWMDVDALTGSRIDGQSARAVTIGLTFRH